MKVHFLALVMNDFNSLAAMHQKLTLLLRSLIRFFFYASELRDEIAPWTYLYVLVNTFVQFHRVSLKIHAVILRYLGYYP